MTLDEIKQIWADSTAEDWQVIHASGDMDPRRRSLLGTPDGDIPAKEHAMRAAYKADLAIGLAWGYETREFTAASTSDFRIPTPPPSSSMSSSTACSCTARSSSSWTVAAHVFRSHVAMVTV